MTVEAPRADSAPTESSVPTDNVYTVKLHNRLYTVVTGHWQFLKAEISEHIESISTQIWQEVSSSLEIH